MSQHVVMPKADWTAALDSLRELTRSSEPIKSGDLAAIIAGVSVFSSGGAFTAFASGSITVASDETDSLTIEHGLDATPNFFLLLAEDLSHTSVTQYILYAVAIHIPKDKSTATCGSYSLGIGYSNITVVANYHLKKSDAADYNSQTDLFASHMFDSYGINVLCPRAQFAPGRTYHWICGVTNNNN